MAPSCPSRSAISSSRTHPTSSRARATRSASVRGLLEDDDLGRCEDSACRQSLARQGPVEVGVVVCPSALCSSQPTCLPPVHPALFSVDVQASRVVNVHGMLSVGLTMSEVIMPASRHPIRPEIRVERVVDARRGGTHDPQAAPTLATQGTRQFRRAALPRCSRRPPRARGGIRPDPRNTPIAIRQAHPRQRS